MNSHSTFQPRSPQITPSIAIIQDALPFLGGAERVLEATLEIFPNAHIYTTIYNRQSFTESLISLAPVFTSFLDKVPRVRKHHRSFFPLYPLIFESINLRAYDLVLSFSYAAAHGVSTSSNQIHLCYKHTPLRQAWSQYHEFLARQSPLLRFFGRIFLHYFRIWDLQSSKRVDAFACVSDHIARQIKTIYRREAQVIYPPVDTDYYHPKQTKQTGDYYLAVTRLEPHKKVDHVVAAFNILGLPIYIIGDGSEMHKLQARAGPNIQFLGYQPDSLIREFMWSAKGFVHAGNEDFGIAMIEAQATGLPVIAYGRGGAAETIIHGVTGQLYTEATAHALAEAILVFERQNHTYNQHEVRTNALQFGKNRFQSELLDFIHSHSGLGVAEQVSIPVLEAAANRMGDF